MHFHTLAMKQLFGTNPSTSRSLAKHVRDTLTLYSIDVNQVVTVTSDNGANMLKAVEMLNDALEIAEDGFEDESDEDYEPVLQEFLNQSEKQQIGVLEACRFGFWMNVSINVASKNPYTIFQVCCTYCSTLCTRRVEIC
jgi:hypothetical protein